MIYNLFSSLRLQPKTSQVVKSCAALKGRDPSKYGSPDSDIMNAYPLWESYVSLLISLAAGVTKA